MKTIILNKRTMSPSNILKNVVEGDIKLLKKAQEYFKAACRSVVGYKQIASYLSVSILVVSSSPSAVIDLEPITCALQQAKNTLWYELVRTNTTGLHNVDRIVKNVYKVEKEILSSDDLSTFRSICIAVREGIKEVLGNLPPGWYFTPTENLKGLIGSIVLGTPLKVIDPVKEELVDNKEEFEEHTPWYV